MDLNLGVKQGITLALPGRLSTESLYSGAITPVGDGNYTLFNRKKTFLLSRALRLPPLEHSTSLNVCLGFNGHLCCM